MRFSVPCLAALALAGCASASPELPLFDSELADGHEAAEHTEVAPGVYLLSSLVASGDVRFVQQTREEFEEAASTRARRGYGGGYTDYDYCYNYDYDSVSDSLSGTTMFQASPSWYGSANAYSYHYDTRGDRYDQDYEQVSAYLWNYTRHPIASMSSMAYVYINGDYAGYVMDTGTNRTTALAYATYDATCEDGTVSIEVRTYQYWNNMGGGGAREPYLYLSYTMDASAACCE
jgi:hypothetical protein